MVPKRNVSNPAVSLVNYLSTDSPAVVVYVVKSRLHDQSIVLLAGSRYDEHKFRMTRMMMKIKQRHLNSPRQTNKIHLKTFIHNFIYYYLSV